MDTIIGVQLFLQLDNSLIAFVEAGGERDHDISLLEQQLLVPVHLGLILFNLLPLALNVREFSFILFSDNALLGFERRSELGEVLDLLAADEHLAAEEADLLFQLLLLFFLNHELARSRFQRGDGRGLVLLGSSLFVFQLHHPLVIHNAFVLLRELIFEPFQLDFILPEQRALVHVLIDPGFVFNLLGSRREFERRHAL